MNFVYCIIVFVNTYSGKGKTAERNTRKEKQVHPFVKRVFMAHTCNQSMVLLSINAKQSIKLIMTFVLKFP